MHKSSRRIGLTLVELLIYAGIFAIVAVFLTGILIITVRVQNRGISSTEVSGQLNTVLQTTQRLVRESSLIERTFNYTGLDGSTPINTPASVCNSSTSAYCGVVLRMSDPALDPTFIYARQDGEVGNVYVKQGTGAETLLNSSRVVVNSLVFRKNEIPGGHATLGIDATMSYNDSNPTLAITRSLSSVVARVNAAVFDDNLIPNITDTYKIGDAISDARWLEGNFTGNITTSAGKIGIGTESPGVNLEIRAPQVAAMSPGTKSGSFGISSTADGFWMGQNTAGAGWLQAGRTDGTATAYNILIAPNGGNVGIGTETPEQKLVVVSSINYNGLTLANTGAATTSALRFTDNSGNSASRNWAIVHQGVNWGDLAFRVSTSGGTDPIFQTVAMILKEDGNVGIGTEGPDVKLHVVDTNAANPVVARFGGAGPNVGIIVDSTASGGNLWSLYSSAATGGISAGGLTIRDSTNGVNALTILPTSGNVGIGTVEPGAYKLNVNGDVNITGTCTGCSAGGGSADVQVFTSSGTWTKPEGAKWVKVIAIGAGGGGGGGQGNTAGSQRKGGGSGGGGVVVTRDFGPSALAATETVTVGAGGASGTGGSSAQGTSGTAGGNSSFGSHVTAYGGGFGNSNTPAGGGGGAAAVGANGGGGDTGGAGGAPGGGTAGADNTDGGNATSDWGGGGGGGQVKNPGLGEGGAAVYGGGGGGGGGAGDWAVAGQAGGRSLFGGGGGGGGGSIPAANTENAGGAGGASASSLWTTGGGGAAGAANGGAGTAGTSRSGTGKAGDGGGGGGSQDSGTGGAGGNGGAPGGGGGGGGGGTTVGGAGGAGGRGEIIVITYF